MEIHVHQSQLNDNVTESADIQTLLTTEQLASLLKDKFLVTAITIQDDSDENLSYLKLTEIVKVGVIDECIRVSTPSGEFRTCFAVEKVYFLSF